MKQRQPRGVDAQTEPENGGDPVDPLARARELPMMPVEYVFLRCLGDKCPYIETCGEHMATRSWTFSEPYCSICGSELRVTVQYL